MSEGSIRIRVHASDSALPIEGALVTIFTPDGNIYRVLTTNIDGETESVPYTTPEEALSLDVNNEELPYSTANIRVSKPGYYINIYEQAQIFSGTTSVQEASLIPLPAANAAESDTQIFVNTVHHLA